MPEEHIFIDVSSHPILSEFITVFFSRFLIIFLVLLVIFLVLRRFFHKGKHLPYAFQKVILLVTLPKEAAQSQKDKDSGLQNIQEQIGRAEVLFSALGGMRAQRGIKPFLFGREDHFSLEIVVHKGLISFYVATPRYLQKYIEDQIQAQFHEAQVEEVDDYNIFSPKGVIIGAYLVCRRSYIFPLKTYKKLESDPLDAITNSLSKVKGSDSAAIQIIARSAKKQWHRWGPKVASEMQQGKQLKEALKTASANPFLRAIAKFVDVLKEMWKAKSKEQEQLTKQKEPYKLSPMEEEVVKGLEEKSAKAGLDTNLRILVSAQNASYAQLYLDNIVNAFSQYNIYEYGNSFKKIQPRKQKVFIQDFIYRVYREKRKVLLNTEELASLYHFPLPTTETPNIRWLKAKKAPAPVNMPQDGIELGTNIYRGEKIKVRIKEADRLRHMYIIGQTGTGKSTIMSEMAKQDIAAGRGVGVIDPHGSLVEDILECIPKERVDDVVIFNPSDLERPVGLNMLEAKTEEEKDFAVQEMIAIFYKLFPPEMIGPMFEHNMRNVMLTLMSDINNPGTIAEIPRMFSDTEFQQHWVKKVKDPVVRAFWEKEMAKTTDFHKSEMLGYLISKVGRFVENNMMRNIIGQSHSGFDFREIMDQSKILLVNLSKGTTGEVNSSLLGLIIVSKLQMAALSRANIPEAERKVFYLYIDEFQNFITDSIETILSEARKYKLALVIAHQFIGQLVKDNNTRIRDAVFGNVGTIISYRIGPEDTELIAKQLTPVVNEFDLMNLDPFHAYIRLLIDNSASKAFSMAAHPPTKCDSKLVDSIIKLSRLKYGRDRLVVESEILERTKLGENLKNAKDLPVEKTL